MLVIWTFSAYSAHRSQGVVKSLKNAIALLFLVRLYVPLPLVGKRPEANRARGEVKRRAREREKRFPELAATPTGFAAFFMRSAGAGQSWGLKVRKVSAVNVACEIELSQRRFPIIVNMSWKGTEEQ